MKAPLPENESKRLEALGTYRVLDTLPEAVFDDLTFLASQICGTPITLLTFIDQDRQWFKSNRGMEVSQTPRDQAFCAHALLQPDEMLIVPDARQDERFADNPLVTGSPHIQFYASAPLVTQSGEVLGTLCVIDQKPRELNPEQKQALQALARQGMAQLELRRNLIEMADHLALRVQAQAALRESEERFRLFMDNSPIVAFLKDQAGRYSYVNQPFLERFGLEHDQVIGKDDFALWPQPVAQELRDHDRSVLEGEGTVTLLETVPTPDGQNHFWQVYKFPMHQGGGQERLLAGVAIDITQNKRYENQLQDYQDKLEQALAEVKAQSLTDGLTGLSNRRAFDRRYEEEISRATRYRLPLSVLMIDIDNFKSYNDSFGHPEGDAVLQKIARLLGESARVTDFVARYGGEEFVILLPSTDRAGAHLFAERFRGSVEMMSNPKRPLTVSVGVSTSSPHSAVNVVEGATAVEGATDEGTLLEAADKALYKAKRGGRNRVVQA